MIYIRLLILAILLLFLIIGCEMSHTGLVLSKIEKLTVDEIDTIEVVPDKNLYLVNTITNRSAGDFTSRIVLIKASKGKNDLFYEFEADAQLGVRVSKEFVAFVKEKGKANWGWFFIENGRIKDSIPGGSRIIDSLKRENVDGFVREVNGCFTLYEQGRVREKYNYGNIVLHKDINYDTLKYQLYQLRGNSLKAISQDPDDIFKQPNGLYFIPAPGYGLVNKFFKKEIYDAVDSVFHLKHPPQKIQIKAR